MYVVIIKSVLTSLHQPFHLFDVKNEAVTQSINVKLQRSSQESSTTALVTASSSLDQLVMLFCFLFFVFKVIHNTL